jgi:site-specific DNA-methyltransferase (adenine-specific)
VSHYYQKGGVTIYHDQFEQMPWVPGAFDAVITDPPYPRQYTPVWKALGDMSAHVLRRGGSLLSIVPHYLLPDVLEEMRQHEPLKYRWICAMWQHGGAHPRMAMGIEVTWKPVVWWVQGAWPQGRGYRIDGFKNNQYPKERRPKLHKWEQSMDWAEYCLKFVPPGGTVVDPMMGSGTLVVAARDQGFTVVGVDNDEAACETTVRRLEGSVS